MKNANAILCWLREAQVPYLRASSLLTWSAGPRPPGSSLLWNRPPLSTSSPFLPSSAPLWASVRDSWVDGLENPLKIRESRGGGSGGMGALVWQLRQEGVRRGRGAGHRRPRRSPISFWDSCDSAQQGGKTHLSSSGLGLNPKLLTTILLFWLLEPEVMLDSLEFGRNVFYQFQWINPPQWDIRTPSPETKQRSDLVVETRV